MQQCMTTKRVSFKLLKNVDNMFRKNRENDYKYSFENYRPTVTNIILGTISPEV